MPTLNFLLQWIMFENMWLGHEHYSVLGKLFIHVLIEESKIRCFPFKIINFTKSKLLVKNMSSFHNYDFQRLSGLKSRSPWPEMERTCYSENTHLRCTKPIFKFSLFNLSWEENIHCCNTCWK